MAETRFHSILKQRVEQQIEKVSAELSSGGLADFSAYKDLTGYIRGLRESLALCDQIEADFDSNSNQ